MCVVVVVFPHCACVDCIVCMRGPHGVGSQCATACLRDGAVEHSGVESAVSHVWHRFPGARVSVSHVLGSPGY